MQAVVTYQRRDGRWVARRASVSVRSWAGEDKGIADSSAEAHLVMLEREASRASDNKEGR